VDILRSRIHIKGNMINKLSPPYAALTGTGKEIPMSAIFHEVKGLYKVVEMKLFRKTPGVLFDLYPLETIPHIDAIDRVVHESNAISPGPVGDINKTWYMHQHQADNLIVLHGQRTVQLYTKEHGQIEEFIVRPNEIYRNGELMIDSGAVLCWPTHVFHRIISGEAGSASINLAVHYEGFDIRRNFDIFDLNTETGDYHVLRKGYEDQYTNNG
jgi:hypothetical protein